MAYDDVVSAVREDDVLQPGQLYFALPINRLMRKIQPEEMAALAVKASSALSKCGCGKKNTYFTTTSENSSVYSHTICSGVADGGSGGARGDGGGRRRRNSTGMLSVIPE